MDKLRKEMQNIYAEKSDYEGGTSTKHVSYQCQRHVFRIDYKKRKIIKSILKFTL